MPVTESVNVNMASKVAFGRVLGALNRLSLCQPQKLSASLGVAQRQSSTFTYVPDTASASHGEFI